MKATPFLSYQEIVIAANVIAEIDYSLFKPPGNKPIEVAHLCLDANGSQALMRLGVRGRGGPTGPFIPMVAFGNTPIPNQTTDGAFPLLKLRYPFTLPANKTLVVELQDTAAATRYASVVMQGFTKSGRPVFPQNQVTIASGGQAYAYLESDESEDVEVYALAVTLNETGTAALNRGLSLRVRPPDGKAWSRGVIPASLCMPHINAAAQIWTPPGDLVLGPDEALQADLFLTGGGTVRIGMVAYELEQGGRS